MAMTRRGFLAGAAGLGLSAAGVGVGLEWPRITHRLDRWVHPVPEPSSSIPAASGGRVVSGSFVSSARGGRDVGWAVAYPPGSDDRARLPVALVLHGRGDDHQAAFGSHALDRYLDDAVRGGTPAYALAAVDGGDHTYWHQRADGDDPQQMILAEFLPLLADRGLRTERIGLSGWSMGGYGALLLAEHLGRDRGAVVAVDSPALWLQPGDSAPGAFDNRGDFLRHDVFAGRPRLAGIPLRVAIGTSDPFYRATREFVAGLSPRPETDFSPGGHDLAFWHHSAPAQVRFLGAALA